MSDIDWRKWVPGQEVHFEWAPSRRVRFWRWLSRGRWCKPLVSNTITCTGVTRNAGIP